MNRSNLTSDILSAWNAIRHGVVDQTNKKREKYWKHWKEHAKQFKAKPFLEGESSSDKIIIITTFGARVRTGCVGKGNTVKVQTVTDALSAISKTIELAGEPSPIYKAEKTYKVPVARLVEGFRREDPPPIPQLAVPIAVPAQCQQTGYRTRCNKAKAIGDLSIIAFFYLLRVGEYTRPKFYNSNNQKIRATRTVQFRIGDIGFFNNGKILPRSSPLHKLKTVDSCTLKISNQKNGRMGQTIHHFATKKSTCPVKALAHRVYHILSNKGTTENLICDVFLKEEEKWYQIMSTDMLIVVRKAATDLQLDKKE